ERARALSNKVEDVSELLAERGPRTGGSMPMSVAYDAPCHLIHAQGVKEAPLRTLAAVPDLVVERLPNSEECCGGAGIYGLTHPELGGEIGSDKVEEVVQSGAEALVSGNPGCMMQIGAGLRIVGADARVFHPVEILDESYRRGGLYETRSKGD
ncbi:MAG: (Fe-S)-binding protein, partial [Longimicrobiales bacterium]